jgi:1-phosphofructokinase family hexose kinase
LSPTEPTTAIAGGDRGAKIVCVTPNVSVDRTFVVPRLVPNVVLRTDRTLAVAGGKGFNVARSLQVLGYQPLTVGMIGGYTGSHVAALARKERLDARWTGIRGETRTCVVIVSRETGTATVINEAGPAVSADEWSAFERAVLQERRRVRAVCLCGSLPAGVPAEQYGSLVARLRTKAVPVFVDSHGDALASAVVAHPTAVKINAEEAAGLLGRKIVTLDDAAGAAVEVGSTGIQQVVITLGSTGAVLALSGGVFCARPPDVDTVSAVGSGDAFLAAYVAAQVEGTDPVGALRCGVAAGAANAQSSWGGTFGRADYIVALERVIVRQGGVQPVHKRAR